MFAINTGKNVTNALPPSRYEVESKFKSILETSSKLEAQYRNAKSLNQLYTANILGLRQRLCEEIKIIFRYAPVEHGRICEEILWKRNYYDYVKFYKKFAKKVNDTELPMIRLHLTSGIGHYHSLLLSFRKIFNLSTLDDLISLPLAKSLPISKKFSDNIFANIANLKELHQRCGGGSNGQSFDNEQNEDGIIIDNIYEDEEFVQELDQEYVEDENFNPTLSYLVHRFFICIGDLARYYVDFFSVNKQLTPSLSSMEQRFNHYYFNFAVYFYKSASICEPSLGMPFNQLGTLFTGSFWSLNSLYYYLRCLNSSKTFVGVTENLRQTCDSVRKMLQADSLKNPANNGLLIDTQNSADLVKRSVMKLINFFSEIFNLRTNLNANTRPISISKLLIYSSETLNHFSLALQSSANIKSKRTTARSNPDLYSTESIFQLISVFIILIEQIKLSLKENMIDVKFEVVKSFKNDQPLTDSSHRGNFILLLSYRFLFQLITVLVQHETKIVRKMLTDLNMLGSNTNKTYSQNLLDAFSGFPSNLNELNLNDDGKMFLNASKRQARKKKTSNHSFSSDFNDQCEDSAMMHQLKSTAMQSIVSLLESDNEDDDADYQQNPKDDDSDVSISDLMENMIYSDDDNELNNDAIYSQFFDNEVSNVPNGHATNNKKSSKKNVSSANNDVTNDLKSSKTMEQLLGYIYSESYTPVIKFFCDYLQSNCDFLDLLQNLDVLSDYFESFFDYLNLLSEFDYKLITGLKIPVSKACLTETDRKNVQHLVDLSGFISNYSSQSVSEFKQKYPLTSEIDYMQITNEMRIYFSQLFNLSPDSFKSFHQINARVNCCKEQYGYVCMRSILVFGIKLSLLSLQMDKLKLSLKNYNPVSVHDFLGRKSVKFVLNKSAIPNGDSMFSNVIVPPLPLSGDHTSATAAAASVIGQHLINLIDPNDNEVEKACSTPSFKDRQKYENKKKSTLNNNYSSRTLNALSKLPYVVIGPYVYLEHLTFVRDLVTQKKAFLVVPKLVSDFLSNIKDSNTVANEANEYLSREFFRGSRMIRFIRSDDRLELELLKYPRYQWSRVTKEMLTDVNKIKIQDDALFYELLEHCHHLLVNKVLVNQLDDTVGVNSGGGGGSSSANGDSNSFRIILIVNQILKCHQPTLDIVKAYGIHVETIESFVDKHMGSNNNNNSSINNNNKFNNKTNKINKKKKIPPQQSQSPMYFMPIQNSSPNPANNHRLKRQVT